MCHELPAKRQELIIYLQLPTELWLVWNKKIKTLCLAFDRLVEDET